MTKRYFYILFFTFVATFSACSKSDNPTTSTMTATVNGVSFSATNASGGPVNGEFVIVGDMAASGTNTEQRISLIIDSFKYTTDTLNINGGNVRAVYINGTANGTASNGTIYITSATKHSAQGSFNFSVSNAGLNYQVSNGSFDVSW